MTVKVMTDKVCLITGATDGIGIVTARRLAEMDCRLILVGRNSEKGHNVITEISEQTGNEKLDFILTDLSSMAEIVSLAEKVTNKYSRLDVLLNNAGAFFNNYQTTSEGLEMTFALNHLNYFLLTKLLRDMLIRSKPARIINVASDAHLGVDVDFENLNGEKNFNGWKAYKISKLENIMFTYLLSEKLKDSGVTANCLHPGFVASKFGHNNAGLSGYLVKIGQKLLAINSEKGAQTSVFLATSEDIAKVSGKYFYKSKEKKSSEYSYHKGNIKTLWDVSESILETLR